MTLKEYLEKKNIGISEFAKKIGIPQSTCSSWVNHLRIPTKNGMQKIFLATGGLVTANDFYGIGK